MGRKGGKLLAGVTDLCHARQAVVSHKGRSAAHGHYVSDMYSGDKQRWNRYDDATVTPLGDARMAQMKEWPREGYLLIYAHNSCLSSAS